MEPPLPSNTNNITTIIVITITAATTLVAARIPARGTSVKCTSFARSVNMNASNTSSICNCFSSGCFIS
jgi:hypothetical protein